MIIVDCYFVHAHAVMLLDTSLRECVNIGPCCPLIKLFVKEPSGEIAECDFYTQIQEAAGTVNAYKSRSQDHDILFGLSHFLQDLDIINVPEADHIR